MVRQTPSPQPGEPRNNSRTALVGAARLQGWTERFEASHGPTEQDFDGDGLLLRAADGTTALLRAPWPVDGRPGRGANELERLASLASQERGLGLVLVRRGGYVVAAASGSKVLASKSGNRYVQSRTSAGGQSQQRFARRRSNQADALAEAAAENLARIFGGNRIEYIVPGGDRALVDQALNAPASRFWASRTRLAFLDVQEPRTGILPKAAADACAIRITVTDGPGRT